MRVFRPAPRRQVPVGLPRIDWSHPLAQGLVGCYLPGISGGINLAGFGGDLAFQVGAGLDAGPEGPALLSASTPAGLNATAPAAFYAGNFFSFYSRNHVTANSGGSAPIIQISDSSSWSSPFVFMGVRAGASGTTAAGGLLLQYSGGGSYQQEAIGQWTAGQTNSVGCSYDMSLGTSGALTGYVNGVPHSTTLTGTKSGPSATAQVNLLTEPSGAGAIAVNAINYCSYFWVRKLSDAEQGAIDQDPHCFLIPAEAEMPALLLSGGATPSGTLATTETTDAAAFTGNADISGTLAATEAADAAAFAGTAGVAGSFASTEAADIAVFAGTAGVAGSLTTNESVDTAAFTGNADISGTLATTEAIDIAAFAGNNVPTGPLATTEASDTAAFTGTVDNSTGIQVAQYTGKLSWEGRRTKRERLEDAKLERERAVRTAAFHQTIKETIRPKPPAIIEPPDEYDDPEPVASQPEPADARPLEIAELEVTAAKARVVAAEITAKGNLAEKTQKTAAGTRRIEDGRRAQREYDDALATVLLLHA